MAISAAIVSGHVRVEQVIGDAVQPTPDPRRDPAKSRTTSIRRGCTYGEVHATSQTSIETVLPTEPMGSIPFRLSYRGG